MCAGALTPRRHDPVDARSPPIHLAISASLPFTRGIVAVTLRGSVVVAVPLSGSCTAVVDLCWPVASTLRLTVSNTGGRLGVPQRSPQPPKATDEDVIMSVTTDEDATVSSAEDAVGGADQVGVGIRQLGMRNDSGRSVLHLWARHLPPGMFDGHRSAMVAPDHLLFHGITKRLVTGTFRLLDVSQRRRVGVSLREALARSHYPTTTVYNAKLDKVSSVGISEWAATLTVFATVLRRTLHSATRSATAAVTPLLTAMEVIDCFSDMVCAAYFFPRLDMDGETACRARLSTADLQSKAEEFFSLVHAACLREDAAVKAFGMMLDTPNLHRLRELVDHVIPALLHIRHAQELLFENAHQPLKRAVLSGNGRADARRAMARYVHDELAARLRLDFTFFQVPPAWIGHAGVSSCLSHARPLWSKAGAVWRCTTGALPQASLHPSVVRIGQARSDPASRIRWRCRASRSSTERMQVNDAVSVRVVEISSTITVQEARAIGNGMMAYFQVIAFFTTRAGTPSAVVHPFIPIGGRRHRVATDIFLYLALSPGVRRALVLHDCQLSCQISATEVSHTSTNVWFLFGRRHGYPARSG